MGRAKGTQMNQNKLTSLPRSWSGIRARLAEACSQMRAVGSSTGYPFSKAIRACSQLAARNLVPLNLASVK